MKREQGNGYTLLEVVAVLGLIGVLFLALSTLTLNGIHLYEQTNIVTEIQENARIGVDFMVRDIKTCQEIVEVRPDSITITGANGSSIRYYVSSQNLYRSIQGTSNPVAMKIISFSIQEVFPEELEMVLITGEEDYHYQLTTRVRKMVD